jgi:hypothetical protein
VNRKDSTSPFKIFFAGIDGSGKSTCLEFLLSKFAKHYRVLKIGPSGPFMFCNGTKKKLCDSFLYSPNGGGQRVHENPYFRGVLITLRFLSNFLIAHYIKFRAGADVIMYESDTVLHPCVYITYHAPWVKQLSMQTRFSIIYRLFGPTKNFLIFYLDVDPVTALERIHRRDTTIQSHENIHDLGILKRELDRVVEIALKKGVEIVRVDTNSRSWESVRDEIDDIIKERFSLVA